jgi:DNA (cytosine-5)-methyltransferase 1
VRHLDLFSGIGGFALACTWVWGGEYENVGHSEVEPYPCKVYHRHFPESECLGDITKIDWTQEKFRNIDLITGGFPCQPHSVAGKRRASEDERDLWGECVRAVRGVRPRFALFENVPGLLVSERGRFFNRVLTDLAESGYVVEYRILSAQSQGAPHKRDRVWIVAYPFCERWRNEQKRWIETVPDKKWKSATEEQNGDIKQCRTCESSSLSNPHCQGLQGTPCDRIGIVYGEAKTFTRCQPSGRIATARRTWYPEPNVGRVAHGIPSRVDRLKGLGNAIVPQCAQVILQAIKDCDRRET